LAVGISYIAECRLGGESYTAEWRLGGVCINASETPYAKFLGVLIDPQLSFTSQINAVSKKLSTSLYFLRNVRNLLDDPALKSIYYATLHSHLIYAIQLWSCCNESLHKPIITRQKMATRIISNSKYNSIFKKLKILPFSMLS